MATGEKRKACGRLTAAITAVMMLIMMAAVLLPGMKINAYYDAYNNYYQYESSIIINTNPVQIDEGSNFSLTLIFPASMNQEFFSMGESKVVDVYAIGDISGSYVENNAVTWVADSVDSSSGHYELYIPSQIFSYNGKGTVASLDIRVNNKTYQQSFYPYTFIPTPGESSEPSSEPAPELIGNQVVVSEAAQMPEVAAGETKSILIPLEAKSSVVGTAQVTLIMPEGLFLNSAAATQSVSFGKGRSETLIAEVTAKKDVTDSVVPITIKSVYEYDGKQVTEETTFSVRLKAAQQIESNGKLVITGYTLGASTLSYNGNTTLDITVENKGSATMKDITMTLDGLATGSVTLKNGMDVQTLTELLPGQTSTFTYAIHADENVPDGTAILTATAACGEETSAAKVFIPCIAKPEDKEDGTSGPGSSKPQVIIESYTYGDENVTGGSTFNLAMVLRNTSSSTAIENIKMVISSAADETTGGVFTPASSSNSFYIARVAAGETFSENIDLTVKADAPPKSYGIDVALSYEAVIDGTRETLTATERITIPVTQPDRFEVDEAQISDYNYVGDSIWCSLNYVNKGKSAIYNLSIAVEGTGFTTGDTNTYVGNVEAGSGDYFETTLNASEAGTLEGKFILTYEDSAGNESTIERPFTTTVQEMNWGMDDPMMEDPSMMEPVDGNTGLPLAGKIVIGVGCAVLIVGIVLLGFRLRRSKKKKAAAMMEDDDDSYDFEDDSYDE